MKKIYLILIITVILCPDAFSGNWTLGRTVGAALKASNKAEIDRLDTKQALLDADNATKGWYPSVTLSASSSYVNKVMEISMPTKTITFGDNDSYDMNVTLRQLIYDGGRLDALKKAGESRAKASEQTLKASELAVEFQAKAAFYNVFMNERQLENANQSLNEAQNHFRDVNARFGQGMALENDVLRAKLRISNAEMDVVSRKSSLEKARAAFRKIAGLAPDEEIEVEFDDNASDALNLDTKNYSALSRPEFRAFDSIAEAYDKKARAAKADNYPSLSLFGKYNYGKPGLNLPANEWMNYFTAGVNLSWNVWDWGKTDNEIEKAIIDKRKTLKNKDEFKSALEQQISEAYADYEASASRVKLAEESLNYAQKTLELTGVSYKEGTSTETDYDNAHTAFSKSSNEKTIARIALLMSAAQIDYVLGKRFTGGNNE